MNEGLTQSTIQALANEFHHCGFRYLQICKRNNHYIYAKSLNGHFIAYEVFRHRTLKSKIINARHYPTRAAFPKDEDFGKWAWTYKNLKDAIEKCISKKDQS